MMFKTVKFTPLNDYVNHLKIEIGYGFLPIFFPNLLKLKNNRLRKSIRLKE